MNIYKAEANRRRHCL